MSAEVIYNATGATVLTAIGRLLAIAYFVTSIDAQVQPLVPTSDTFINVTGPLRYSRIAIPAGVKVSFGIANVNWPVPFIPAVIQCDGDVQIDGTVSVEGDLRWGAQPRMFPAGVVNIAPGLPGTYCGNQMLSWPSPGLHASAYGSAVPFSLEGGSPSGPLFLYFDPLCGGLGTIEPPHEGGGTVAILAGGRIDVFGTITADGDDFHAGGSGGSILLRAEQGVTLHPGSRVSAVGGQGGQPHLNGDIGFVRIDAWGARPVLQGTVSPTPTVLQLPHLRSASLPVIGTSWRLEMYAPANAPCFVAAALLPALGTPTPFGALGIDLNTAATLAVVSAPAGHDPHAVIPWQIPNAAPLVGISLWLQGLCVPGHLAPRLSNTLPTTIR
jgi:hypothetical protein